MSPRLCCHHTTRTSGDAFTAATFTSRHFDSFVAFHFMFLLLQLLLITAISFDFVDILLLLLMLLLKCCQRCLKLSHPIAHKFTRRFFIIFVFVFGFCFCFCLYVCVKLVLFCLHLHVFINMRVYCCCAIICCVSFLLLLFCCVDSTVSFLSYNSAFVLCACPCCCLTSLRVVAVGNIYICVSACVCLLCKMCGRLSEIFEFSPFTVCLPRVSFRFGGLANRSRSTVRCRFVNQSRGQFAFRLNFFNLPAFFVISKYILFSICLNFGAFLLFDNCILCCC